MKKFLHIISVCLLAHTAVYAYASKPLVVTTASMFADMTRQIAGELVKVRSIVPIGGDPHIYEPVPDDVALARQAQLILRNELTFEGWLNELIENSGTKAQIVTITQGITPIQSAQYHNATDPHAWMSAANGLIYIRNIYQSLLALLPQHRDTLEARYQRYASQIQELDQWIFQQIDSIPPQWRILITSHDAFQYYGRRYGLQLESVLGTSTDADVRTADIMRLYQVLDKHQVPAIFIESTINPKLLQQVAKDKHVRIGGKLYADSLGPKDSPAGTYIGMLQHNTRTIVRALTGQHEAQLPIQPTPAWLWMALGVVQIGSLLWISWHVWE